MEKEILLFVRNLSREDLREPLELGRMNPRPLKVPTLIETLERRPEFATVKLAWASGLMLVVRQP